jgi:hypothetical protein
MPPLNRLSCCFNRRPRCASASLLVASSLPTHCTTMATTSDDLNVCADSVTRHVSEEAYLALVCLHEQLEETPTASIQYTVSDPLSYTPGSVLVLVSRLLWNSFLEQHRQGLTLILAYALLVRPVLCVLHIHGFMLILRSSGAAQWAHCWIFPTSPPGLRARVNVSPFDVSRKRWQGDTSTAYVIYTLLHSASLTCHFQVLGVPFTS